MTPGDIILVAMPTRKGKGKKRPALVLQKMLPFEDLLVCGISSQLHYEVKGFDLIIREEDQNFRQTGLKRDSLIRLGYITTIAKNRIPGKIGRLPAEHFETLITRLTNFLHEPL